MCFRSPNTEDPVLQGLAFNAIKQAPNQPTVTKPMYKKKHTNTPPHRPSHSLALRPSQRLLLHRLLKHLQRQRGLIIRHLVPGPEHPQEAEVVNGLERAALGAGDGVRGQGRGGEGGLAGVGDRVGGGEAAEPVADPVGVAGPEDDADAALDDGGEGGEEVAGVCFLGERGGSVVSECF